jgi:ankyrin repeat protein
MSQEQLFEYAREGNLIKLGQMVDAEDLGATDADGMTALMHAAANNNYGVAGLFVGKDEANINAQDNVDRTALMHASAVGASKIVKMLLKKGADPALTDNEGKTALDYADASGDAKTLKRLRELS